MRKTALILFIKSYSLSDFVFSSLEKYQSPIFYAELLQWDCSSDFPPDMMLEISTNYDSEVRSYCLGASIDLCLVRC